MKARQRAQNAGRKPADAGRQGTAPLEGFASLVLEEARRQGLMQDLLEAFGGDSGKAGEVLALACCACTEEDGFERVSEWLNAAPAPGSARRVPARILADISPDAAGRFLALRRARHAEGPFLAGISRPAPQEGPGAGWGRSCIVYAWPSMEPVHAAALPPGGDVVADAAALGRVAEAFGMPLASTAFGEESGRADLYGDLLHAGRPFLASADPADYPASWRIRDDVHFDRSGDPANMDFDPASGLSMAQFDISDTEYKTPDGEWEMAEDYVCHLSFDATRHAETLKELKREEALVLGFAKKLPRPCTQETLDAMNQQLRHYTLAFGEPPFAKPGDIVAMSRADEIKAARTGAGFTAAVAWKTPASPGEVLRAVAVRDEQERFFQRLQERAADLASGLDDASKLARLEEGLRFAGFVGFLLQAFARRLWEQSRELRDAFASPAEALHAACRLPPQRGTAPSFLQRELCLFAGAGREEAE